MDQRSAGDVATAMTGVNVPRQQIGFYERVAAAFHQSNSIVHGVFNSIVHGVFNSIVHSVSNYNTDLRL
jgi:hypothetical protein